MAVVGIAGNDRLGQAREALRAAEGRLAGGEPHLGERFLPVAAPLARLLPGGGLRRGTVVALTPAREPAAGRRPEPRRPPGGPGRSGLRRPRVRWGTGGTSLLWALLSAASAEGAWIGVVGRPDLGLVAAAEAGVRLDRLAVVPDAGDDLLGVTSALLDGLDVVVAGSGTLVPAPAARERLAARARQRGSVLLALGPWPGADLELACTGSRWSGIGEGGSGRLRARQVEVRAHGRGIPPAGREVRLVLPGDLEVGSVGSEPDGSGLPARAAG